MNAHAGSEIGTLKPLWIAKGHYWSYRGLLSVLSRHNRLLESISASISPHGMQIDANFVDMDPKWSNTKLTLFHHEGALGEAAWLCVSTGAIERTIDCHTSRKDGSV